MGENKGKGDEKEKKPIENQKDKNGGGSEKKKEGGGGGGAEKKEEGPPKVVLKVDMHCEGCASKIKRWAKGFEGVEGVTLDMANNKLTVIGSADPWKLREHLEAKTRKKVEIVSPVNPPKKESGDGKKAAATDGKKPADGQKKSEAAGDSKDKQKPADKKSKEPVASTVVLRIRLHCDGCIQRIKKTIFKIKGVQDVSVDAQKDLVTVKGTMDVNSLPSYLKDKLNRGVEIVSATTGAGGGGGGSEKKEKPAAAASGGAGGGEKKEKGGGGGGGGEKKGNGGGGGGEKKGKDGGDGGKKEEPASATASAAPPVVEANRMEYYGGPYGYRAEMLHAPQLFSDENPNACSVM
ncbi:heavy metal-associated isoprenylated plant protein 3 [Dendrobium catenatum]|uniref:heavy metal-associated isoprenylated plant protein 3 n=1 Tax=Dendrobium catenatum TaxID=906689 RepID=UPI0009F4A5B6|nr:heavy metal-associated isoprenylated plant protein 3 [Dendrobium catenatum]